VLPPPQLLPLLKKPLENPRLPNPVPPAVQMLSPSVFRNVPVTHLTRNTAPTMNAATTRTAPMTMQAKAIAPVLMRQGYARFHATTRTRLRAT
jgi:hypothetical protein